MAEASGFHVDGHVESSCFEYGLGVPVGQAKAAVGFGASDLFGFRGAVNAVARAVEADPPGADGIIRSGGNNESVVDALALGDAGENFRVEGIIGVGSEGHDSKFP